MVLKMSNLISCNIVNICTILLFAALVDLQSPLVAITNDRASQNVKPMGESVATDSVNDDTIDRDHIKDNSWMKANAFRVTSDADTIFKDEPHIVPDVSPYGAKWRDIVKVEDQYEPEVK